MYIAKLFFILSFVMSLSAQSSEITEEELEAWFNEDENLPIQVDKGQLLLLPKTDHKILHSISQIYITPESIKTGWVKIEQCYKHLDPINLTEIVYQYQFIKNFHITDSKNIQSATINQNRIVLKNITKQSLLCIEADVKILNKNPDSTYSIKNGPYHRRFLDGYFPFHVTLVISYPESLLKIKHPNPANATGLSLKEEKNKVIYDNVFAGQLTINTVFQSQ